MRTPLRSPRPSVGVASVFVCLMLGGCATTITLGAPTTAIAFPATGTLRAAAARVDVTPPPGLGLFGHGPESRRAEGHRGRLHCRALVLEDASGSRIAFVACDLAAISAALHREVATRVHDATGLGIERIVLSATHTHAGPAHYFADANYAGALSSSVSGYDPAVTRMLATRIAGAIIDASSRLAPARLSFVEERIVGPSDTIPAIGQNRSLEAHCQNTSPMGSAASTCGSGLADAYAEIEGMLSLLVVEATHDDGTATPLAVYGSYPVHATSVPNTNDLYHADLFGEAARMVEARAGSDAFVAAIANGAEGDVRPDYDVQSFDEALRLGRALGAHVLEAIGRATPLEDTRISAAFEALALSEAEVDGTRLCEHPELGRASAGGSEEGRTGFHALPRWREGSRDEDRGGCHGPRAPVAFRRIAQDGFPLLAPLGVVTVGPLTFVAIPAEATTTTGIRLRARIASLRSGPVVLVGLANDYLQYVATSEEFVLQHYEGASTLYGPGTARVLTGRFEALTRSIVAGAPIVSASPLDRRLRLRDRLARETITRGPSIVDARPTRFEGHSAYEVDVEASDAATLLSRGGAFARVERRAAQGEYVPAHDMFGRTIDDLGPYVIVRQTDASRDGGVYRVTFVVPDDAMVGSYRLVFRSGGRDVASAPFPFSGVR